MTSQENKPVSPDPPQSPGTPDPPNLDVDAKKIQRSVEGSSDADQDETDKSETKEPPD
ncbi:MAG: hypothetical protein ABW224_08350 [Kibdelosporangium sp.]